MNEDETNDETERHTYEHGKKAPVDLTAPLQVKIILGKTSFMKFLIVRTLHVYLNEITCPLHYQTDVKFPGKVHSIYDVFLT